jgi:capsular polysaccharide biosynthesis protein
MLKLAKRFLDPLIFSARPPLCENILDYAIQRAWPVTRIHDPFLLDIPVPQGCTEPALLNRYTMHSRMGFPAQFLMCIPDGVSFGGGFVRLATGEFLTESSWRPQYLLDSKIYRARFHSHKVHFQGDYCNLHAFFGGNYGHWLYDEIPRLFNALRHLPPTTRFLVPEPLEPWKLDTLLAIGITEERLCRVPAYFEVRCERLWFATHLGDSEQCVSAPDIASEVRNAFLNHFCASSACAGPERIFVSRASVSQRRLANEGPLRPILDRYGFTIVSPEEFPVKEQVAMFANAKIVVGAFGAALTNIMFSPPGATLIDLQDEIHAPRIWFWKFASIYGHRYRTIVGKTVDNRAWGDVRFKVELKLFERAIGSSCAEGNSDPGWFS